MLPQVHSSQLVAVSIHLKMHSAQLNLLPVMELLPAEGSLLPRTLPHWLGPDSSRSAAAAIGSSRCYYLWLLDDFRLSVVLVPAPAPVPGVVRRRRARLVMLDHPVVAVYAER